MTPAQLFILFGVEPEFDQADSMEQQVADFRNAVFEFEQELALKREQESLREEQANLMSMGRVGRSKRAQKQLVTPASGALPLYNADRTNY